MLKQAGSVLARAAQGPVQQLLASEVQAGAGPACVGALQQLSSLASPSG